MSSHGGILFPLVFKENLIVISKVQLSGMGSHECIVSGGTMWFC